MAKINRLIPLPTAASGLSISISLLEQAIFVNASLSSPSVLRGCVELVVSRNVQLRDLVIKFRGVTKFPRYATEECIIDSAWPVPQLESRTDTDSRVLQPNIGADGQRQWPVLKAGRYAYDFELTLDQPLPETFNVGGCKLKYKAEAIASVPGLRRQVAKSQEVPVVHCPRDFELHLHEANQISLSRIWNRQITYNVEISDKSAPIGGEVPIAVRIGCSDILFIAVQVYLGQKIKFPGIPGKQSQIRKKLLLKSKCSDPSTGKFNDNLPSLKMDREYGATIITGHVPLVDEPNAALRLHPDVNFKKVKATHTILILIDITIPNTDESNPQKTTVCRLTAETPFRVRSPHTQNYDLSVPEYTEPHDLAADNDSPLPPPFSPTQSSPQLSQQSASSTDTTAAEHPVSRRGPSTRPYSWAPCRTSTALDHISPPPAYESIVS